MYIYLYISFCISSLFLEIIFRNIFQTSTAFSMEIFLSSRTLISIIRLAASDGVGIVVVVVVVPPTVEVCKSCNGADSNLRVDDDDE